LCVHFWEEDEDEEEDIYDYTVRTVWGRPPSDSIERNKKKYFFSYFLNKNQVGLKGKKRTTHTRIKNSFAHARIIFIFIFGLNPAGKLAAAAAGCRLSV
jgi:hypothetical protein